MKLQQIQTEQVEWVRRNFPNRSPHHPLLGIIEEFGELVDALHLGGNEQIADAVGDVVIFACDYCTAMGLDAQALADHPDRSGYGATYSGIISTIGALAHSHLKLEQGIRGTRGDHLIGIAASLSTLFQYLHGVRSDVEEIAWATWLEVRKRDWTARPETG